MAVTSTNKKELYSISIQLGEEYKPTEAVEFKSRGKDWVLNGQGNDYYKYIDRLYHGSPTNAAVINSMVELIFGEGLKAKNEATNINDYIRMLSILSPMEAKKMILDLKKTGQYAMQIIRRERDNEISSIYHIPIEYIAPEKKNDDGVIEHYFYSECWENPKGKHTPEPHPNFDAFDSSSDSDRPKSEIKVVRMYQTEAKYFSKPDYVAAMPYCEMEIEIANFYVSHIKNGLSFGHVVNFNNGVPTDDSIKDALEKKVKGKLTGSKNAGRVLISFNDNKDNATTIDPVEGNSSHEQWQYLTEESRQQIITGHRVTSPMLLGIKDNTGLGNNADEIVQSSVIFFKTVVEPFQLVILQALESVFASSNINLDLYFKPLLDVSESPVQVDEGTGSEPLSLSDEGNKLMDSLVDKLIELGEEPPSEEEYDLIDVRRVEGIPSEILPTKLATVVSSSPATSSEQDNELFKVRYVYAGNPAPERNFCRKMMLASKVYRKEDIESAESIGVNPGFGPRGTNTYSIWLYKGGPNCKHYWQRRVYLRRNNKRISVNEARRMILDLEPEERANVRLPENDSKVARIPYDQQNRGYLNPR